VVITDDMQMRAIAARYGLETAIRQAILAGADILLFANNSVYEEDIAARVSSTILTLVEKGEIPGADRRILPPDHAPERTPQKMTKRANHPVPP